MKDSKQEATEQIVELYQSLTIDQCKELYLRQKDNMSAKQRLLAKVIIGSKFVYGTNYIPNLKNKNKLKDTQN